MGRLEGLHRADAAIVGGGLTGLLLAASLADAGMRVAVVASENEAPEEAARASLLDAHAFARVKNAYGVDASTGYADDLRAQLHALLDEPPPYVRDMPVYAYALTAAELPALEAQHALYQRLHIPVSIAPDAGGCPFPVELSLTTPGAAVDLPRWIGALHASIRRNGGRIFSNSPVIAIENTRVHTQKGCVEAPHILLTTGKPQGLRDKRLTALLETRVIARCTMTALFPLHSCQQPLAETGLSLLPLRGGALVLQDTGRMATPLQHARLLRFGHELRTHLPDWQPGEIRYSQHVTSADSLPVIGALPGTQLLCASGVQGVLGAMHAAQVLTRRILGTTLPQDAQYAPDRAIPACILRRERWRMLRIFAGNALRLTAPECAHCSCRLRYSTMTRRWECALCGTAYDMFGQPISGPGMAPARVSVRQRPDI